MIRSLYLSAFIALASGFAVSAHNSEDSAGRRKSIVNGNIAPIDAYPWFSAPVFRRCDSEDFTCENTLTWNGCGGVLVAPDFVLTAAHCPDFPNPVANPGFRVGAYCVDPESTDMENNCGQNFDFQNRFGISSGVFTAPGWDISRGTYDFRLHQLREPIDIKPIAVDDGTVSLTPGDKLTFVGLGLTAHSGSAADILQEMEAEVVGSVEAFQRWDETGYRIPRNLKDLVIFARSSESSSCDGDGGGPLIKGGVLVGILSFGLPKCNVGASDLAPAGFGRVSLVHEWIVETVCAHTAADPIPSYCISGGAHQKPTGGCNEQNKSKFNRSKIDSDEGPIEKKCSWLSIKEKRKKKFCKDKYDALERCDVTCGMCFP